MLEIYFLYWNGLLIPLFQCESFENQNSLFSTIIKKHQKYILQFYPKKSYPLWHLKIPFCFLYCICKNIMNLIILPKNASFRSCQIIFCPYFCQKTTVRIDWIKLLDPHFCHYSEVKLVEPLKTGIVFVFVCKISVI